MRFKWFIRTQTKQNLQFVNLKRVTYEQPIPLPLTRTDEIHYKINHTRMIFHGFLNCAKPKHCLVRFEMCSIKYGEPEFRDINS